LQLKNKAILGVKWTTLSTIVITVFQIIQLYVLAKLLTPKDFGLMAIVIIITIFIRNFSDLGVSAALIHYQDTDSEQMSTLFWLNIIVGFFLFSLVLISSPLISEIYSEPILKNLLIILSFSFIISPFGSLFHTVFQKELQFGVIAKIEIIGAVIGVSCVIILAYWGYGVWSIVYGQLVGFSIRALLFLIIGIKYYEISFYFNIKKVKKYLDFGFFQVGEKAINFLSERADQFLIGYLLGSQSLGYYNFAFNIVNQPVTLINPIFTKVAFPVFSKVQNQKDLLKNYFLKVLKILLLINAPIFLGLVVIAPGFIQFIFGEKWSESIILIQILSFLSIFRAIGNPSGIIVLSKGRADISFYWNIALLVLTIPTVFFTAKMYGIIGVGIGLLALQLFLFLPNYFILVAPFIGKFFRDFNLTIIKSVSYAIAMAVIVYFVPNLFLNPSLFLIFIQISLGIILYFLLLFIFQREYIFEIKKYLFP